MTDETRQLTQTPNNVAFSEVRIESPHLSLRFKATPERISRLLEVVLKEARESEFEYEQSLKQK